MFGLKSLHQEDILAAFLEFCDKAGPLALQFCCNCDKKLFVAAFDLSYIQSHPLLHRVRLGANQEMVLSKHIEK
jgi:hypothetical protein